jgi:predicted hydrocarbon binding protein
MENIFLTKQTHNTFTWANLGDVKEGRGDLGEEMPVMVYRLMQYTMLDILTKAHGLEQANEYFRQAGFLAGTEFARNVLDLNADFDTFFANLQQALQKMKIGILRIEAFDASTGNVVLTVGQDLDCSGLPVTNETVCFYDEGFISGILETYTGKKYDVREVDCWSNGDRVCRFNGIALE